MSAEQAGHATAFGPWNPGLRSQIPAALAHLATIFRPESVFTTPAEASELADLTGLEPAALVVFRPERLALHEVLVRVMADFSVPDGQRIEDLGINFRAIVRTILARYAEPRMQALVAAYDDARSRIVARVDAELPRLARASAPAAPRQADRWWSAWRRRPSPPSPPEPGGTSWDPAVVAEWEARAHGAADALDRAACRALARVVTALLTRHGRPWGTSEMIARLATGLACNDAAGDRIGDALEPMLAEAAEREGFRRLPPQDRPVVMNTKGASASGKSTLRPLQRGLAARIGVDWAEFALISPDIWRKQLLDYGSLGDAYKYAGAFTGDEVALIDRKLDRYMARKAQAGEMTHLLIDRFRFDSFAPDSDEAGSNLLTRFGELVYLFLMITPPASLVERAWRRGLEVGRYKAVDDVLAHAIEAYGGMPGLFFTWANRTDKRVHFEFLDNSVAQGERPRTVAFGWNDALHVLDVGAMLDVERFRRVDVDAAGPEALYPDRALLAPERNTGFLVECVRRFREVNFADQATGRIYAHFESGRLAWIDSEALARAATDPDVRAALLAAAPDALSGASPAPEGPIYLREHARAQPIHTLGAWGPT
ncbi:MAG TPA: hypothetical protein VET86_09290 [Casimicrobiaceae bacterium]|nr:hypothetical protein [Casimicrobiaceae bacterium]